MLHFCNMSGRHTSSFSFLRCTVQGMSLFWEHERSVTRQVFPRLCYLRDSQLCQRPRPDLLHWQVREEEHHLSHNFLNFKFECYVANFLSLETRELLVIKNENKYCVFLLFRFLGYQFTTYGTNVLSQTEGNITARTDYLNVVFPKVIRST